MREGERREKIPAVILGKLAELPEPVSSSANWGRISLA